MTAMDKPGSYDRVLAWLAEYGRPATTHHIAQALAITRNRALLCLRAAVKNGDAAFAPHSDTERYPTMWSVTTEAAAAIAVTGVPTGDLGLSTRTRNCLLRQDIGTAGAIADRSEQDLVDIWGLGEEGIKEIKRALDGLGLALSATGVDGREGTIDALRSYGVELNRRGRSITDEKLAALLSVVRYG